MPRPHVPRRQDRGSVWRRTALSVSLVLAVGVVACEQHAPAPPLPAAPAPAVIEVPTPAAAQPDPAVAAALAEMRVRQRCNRVMGCQPAVDLFQHGAAAVAPIVAVVDAAAADARAGYWLVRLLDLLRQLDDDRALPSLHTALADRRWEIRAMAALSLARLARPASRAVLEAAWQRQAQGDGGDLAFTGVLLHALERTGGRAAEQPPRALLAQRLALDRDQAGRLNPGFYAFLNRLVREARLPAALPLVRLGAIHRDRFVRLEALRTLGALQDTGGIPYAATRLDDELPSVRRAAVSALQGITGSRTLGDEDAWRRWCEQRSCLAPLRGDAAEGGGG